MLITSISVLNCNRVTFCVRDGKERNEKLVALVNRHIVIFESHLCSESQCICFI